MKRVPTGAVLDLARAATRALATNRSAFAAPRYDDQHSSGDLADSKYLLHVPPSWSLHRYWMQGAVVLLADSPTVEWYYPALRDGVTHVSVTPETASMVLETLRASDGDPKIASQQRVDPVQALRHAALKVQKQFLCPTCTLKFLQHALNGIAHHFGAPLVLDDPKLRRAFLRNHVRAWDGTMLELQFGTGLALVDHYGHESWNLIKEMIRKTDDSDSLLFVRSVAGDALAPTTSWRLHDWRPDNDVIAYDLDEDAP